MSIEIVYDPAGYRVSVTPPDAGPWKSPRYLTATEVLEALSKMGCHSTDVTDALYAANPDWPQAHDAEVRRRRDEELRNLGSEPPDNARE